MFATTLLTVTFILLGSVISSTSTAVVIQSAPITFRVSRRLNLSTNRNLLQHDQARAKALLARAENRVAGIQSDSSIIANEPVNNQAVIYVAAIGVGTPPTSYDLLIDTGSSNTWVGANKSYVKTNSSVQTNQSVSVTYGSGFFSGNETLDTVTITPQLVIHNQSIGVATVADGFQGVDGILGIGPVDLTVGALADSPNTKIPTVTDNLFSQGTIRANEIGISFEPTNGREIMNGEITWGGTDSSKYTGTINFAPITTTSPSSKYWGIKESIRYGTSTTILSSTVGVVDTGTTLILLATDAYDRYMKATGAVQDFSTGLLRITNAQYSNLKSLFFDINGVQYEFTANAQLWPRSLNADIGGKAGDIYLIVGNLGSNSGQGLDFINGYAFLERFYSVFDTTGHRVGFATTPFTTATTN